MFFTRVWRAFAGLHACGAFAARTALLLIHARRYSQSLLHSPLSRLSSPSFSVTFVFVSLGKMNARLTLEKICFQHAAMIAKCAQRL